MLISLKKLCSKYCISEFGVLHIGAHQAEERGDYENSNAKRILWIEANPDLANRLKSIISEDRCIFEREDVINAAIFDIDDRKIMFRIANNTQASSLLEFGTHSKSYPAIGTEKTIEVITRRIDALAKDYPDLFRNLDFANLDIQGVELSALRGFGELLDQFKWVYTEVNRKEVYTDNGMIWDIDSLLLKHGFFRKETVFTNDGWGDAFYQKQLNKNKVFILAYKIRVHCEYFIGRFADFAIFIILRRICGKLKRKIMK